MKNETSQHKRSEELPEHRSYLHGAALAAGKFVDGVWYHPDADGKLYRQFAFQERLKRCLVRPTVIENII